MKLLAIVSGLFLTSCMDTAPSSKPQSQGQSAQERFAERVANMGADASTPLTDEVWEGLDRADRISIVELAEERWQEGYWEGMEAIRLKQPGQEYINLDEITDVSFQQLARQIDADMRDVVYMDVMDTDGNHSVIGEPEVWLLYYLVRTHDRKVMGASIHYYQQGCDMPDREDDVQHFSSVEEAEEAGCDLSDVNWQASGVYGPDAQRISFSETFMEWSGY